MRVKTKIPNFLAFLSQSIKLLRFLLLLLLSLWLSENFGDIQELDPEPEVDTEVNVATGTKSRRARMREAMEIKDGDKLEERG